MKIVIVGGVAGGAGAAAAARRANEKAEIEVYEAGEFISFANCGLPYYLSGEINQREKLLVTSPELMKRRFNIDVHVKHRVVSINRQAKRVVVQDEVSGKTFERDYDRLVLATGARSIRPPIPGLQHERVRECRTVDDVDALSDLIQRYPQGRAAVIGAGFIGIEVAEALAMRGLKVTLVGLAPQVLPQLDPEIAGVASRALQDGGINLMLSTETQQLEHQQDSSVLVTKDGKRLEFDFAVAAIGVIPDITLAKEAGLEIGSTGGVVVNEYQQTSDPDIYAAGDVTELLYWPTQQRMKLALAGPANKQGRVAGRNAALAKPQLKTTGAAGTSIIRVFETALGSTGLSETQAAKLGIEHAIVYTQNGHHAGYFPGASALFIKLIYSPTTGRVLGAQVCGKEGVDKRLDVFATAIQAKMTVDDLAELDLAYAPPFGSAKDAVIIAGMVASNAFHKRTALVTPKQLKAQLAATAPLVLDVRSPAEFEAGQIAGAINIPIEELRERIQELPKDKPIVTHCAVGYRGYLAECILRQSGFGDVRNLTGGFRAWQLCDVE